jgi:hypothetical protein
MNIHNLQLSTGQQVLLLDQFLSPPMLKKTKDVFATFLVDNPSWVRDPANAPVHVRYRFDAYHPAVKEIEEYLQSPSVIEPISRVLGIDLKFQTLKFWVDNKMLLNPHKEQPMSDIAAAQIYITDQEQPFLGTVINQDDKKILFQLPFRNNFGWLFAKAEEVMHSKITETPESFNRCSLMIFFERRPL